MERARLTFQMTAQPHSSECHQNSHYILSNYLCLSRSVSFPNNRNLQFNSDLSILITRAASPTCPIDGNTIARDSSFHDKCCEREVLDLPCFCQYEARGCNWRGELRHVQVKGFRRPLNAFLSLSHIICKSRSWANRQECSVGKQAKLKTRPSLTKCLRLLFDAPLIPLGTWRKL